MMNVFAPLVVFLGSRILFPERRCHSGTRWCSKQVFRKLLSYQRNKSACLIGAYKIITSKISSFDEKNERKAYFYFIFYFFARKCRRYRALQNVHRQHENRQCEYALSSYWWDVMAASDKGSGGSRVKRSSKMFFNPFQKQGLRSSLHRSEEGGRYLSHTRCGQSRPSGWQLYRQAL